MCSGAPSVGCKQLLSPGVIQKLAHVPLLEIALVEVGHDFQHLRGGAFVNFRKRKETLRKENSAYEVMISIKPMVHCYYLGIRVWICICL